MAKKFKGHKPRTVMQIDMDDAKTVFDRLRFKTDEAGAGRVDVDVSIFPTPETIVAELRYNFDGTEWAAVVTKEGLGGGGGGDDSGVPVYRLWYQRGKRFQKSGVFPDGAGLVGYLRDQAGKKFQVEPSVDTLDRIKNRKAASLVPDCYGTFPRKPQCAACPYEEKCFEKAEKAKAVNELWVDGVDLRKDGERVEEPEAVFLARLRKKVKSQNWEGE